MTVDLDLTDPDGTGGITRQEVGQTLIEDLAVPQVRAGSAVSVNLGLDSNLVDGTDNGTVTTSLNATQLVPSANGDGTHTFPAPTVTVGQGLGDLAKVTPSDAIVSLAQMAAAYTTAQSRMDPRLPLVDTAVSEIASAVGPLNKLVEAQGAAAVSCGRADTNPPAATTVPGTTWYCQARTAEPVKAGSVQWSTPAGTTITNGTSDATVGPHPTANVAVTGSSTEPEISVAFKTAGSDGTDLEFTAQRRIRTAQELASRLRQLPGGSVTTAYGATSRALTFALGTSSDPAAKPLPINVGDLFRQDARLRGVETTGTLSVDPGTIGMSGTLGMLLAAPAAEATTVSQRAFLKVDPSAAEVSLAGLATSGGTGSFSGTGSVGYLGVTVAGSGVKVASTGMAANIGVTGSLTAGGGTSLTNAALLTNVLASETTSGAPLTGTVNLDADAVLTVSAPQLPAGPYTTTLDFPVNLTTPSTGQPPLPTVTTNDAWKTWLTPLDVAPEVAGRASAADTTGVTLTDSSATFTGGDLGQTVAAGTVLNLSLVNLRSNASCSFLKVVSATQLTCMEQGSPNATTGEATYVESRMVGGKVPTATPANLTDENEQNDYDVDNKWQVGDGYVIEGDPNAVKGAVTGGLYDVANAIDQSEESVWNSPLPVVGLTPHDLVPQAAKLRELAAEVTNLADEVRPADCAVSEAGCPSPASLEKAPADLTALEAALESRADTLASSLDSSATASTDRVDLTVKTAVDGKPHVVAEIALPAKGDAEIPLSADLTSAGTSYYLERAENTAGATKSLKAQWASTLTVKLAVPTNPDTDFRAVRVLPGTGVSSLTVTVDKTDVDLTGSLGPVNVEIGKAAALVGDHTEPADPGPLRRAIGTVTVAGTNTGTGTTLTDAEVDLGKLAGSSTKATRTSDGLQCDGATATGTSLVCDLPDAADDGNAETSEVRSWASGEAYTLASSSTTVLTDTSADFTTANVAAGDVVVTFTTDSAGARTTEGVCTVGTVAEHQVVCAGPLSNGKSFTSGTAARRTGSCRTS